MAITAQSKRADLRLGLRANWRQFALLVVINAFVGGMVGLERTVVPLIAAAEFGVASRALILSFLIAFGVAKAAANLLAGGLSDRIGRRSILIVGWIVGLPVPLLIMFAPRWSWVVFANVLLGINQGLCWSTTVIMKIDLAGPKQRGLAMGLNESAGYLAASLAGVMTGFLATAYGLRPVPFVPGVAFALLGLLGSVFFVHETHHRTRYEAHNHAPAAGAYSFTEVFKLTSWKHRTLFSISQAGFVNNLNDAMIWGLAPVALTEAGLSLTQTAVISSAYLGIWGLGQLMTGALSDRWGRKGLIVAGMWVQAVGIALFVIARAFWPWLVAAVVLGVGTALVYPTLLAAVSDVAHPRWRGSAVGVYRLWRDGGYAVGALVLGWLSDRFGYSPTVWVVAALTFLSGSVAMGFMGTDSGRMPTSA